MERPRSYRISFPSVKEEFHQFSSQRRNENQPKRPQRHLSPRKYPIGKAALNDLLSNQPFIIARKLIDERSGYGILISQDNISSETLDTILQILNLAVQCKTDREATLQLMLLTFQKPQFINQLCSYTSDLKFKTEKANEFLPYIVNIIDNFVRITPTEASSKVASLTDICSMVLQQLKSANAGEFSILETILESVHAQLQDCQVHWANNQKRGNSRYEKLDSFSPPEDFRTLEVIPCCNDLLQTSEPFLRRNIEKGSYKDSQHYLDVQFRLLREDFIRPLREGLQQHFIGSHGKNTDVRIYENVQYKSSKIEEKGLVFYLTLNLRRNFNPDKSKSLMFGNILCISHDNFQSMVIASVCNRDLLKDKQLGIKFETKGNFSNFFDMKKIYTMVESKAYFVSYMHTLKALQKMKKVPLEIFIVKVEDSTSPPNYIKRFSTYDFSCISKLKGLKVLNDEDEKVGSSKYSLHNKLKRLNAVNVCLLDGISKWPSSDSLQLDESQRKALHGALTRQLAVIQGPPGTGKTYVGLQIAKLLLFNKDVWIGGTCDGQSPILVVCYTNHALDQFLEGISQFTSSIIRVGSRSKCEALDQFQIRNFIRQRDFGTNIGHVLSSSFGKALDNTRYLKGVLQTISKLLIKFGELGIIHIKTFLKYDILPDYFRRNIDNLKSFLIWDDEQSVTELVNRSRTSNHEVKKCNKNNSENISYNNIVSNNDIDKEIFDGEQYARILDDMNEDEEHELENEYSALLNFELTETEHDHALTSLNKKLGNIDQYHRRYLSICKQIEALKNVWKVVVAGLTIKGSFGDCERLEKKYVNQLTLVQRWKLYNHWKQKLINTILQEKATKESEYMEAARNLESLRNLEYLSVMKKVDVVGMTTTGAAQYWDVLHDLAPPIVIVEEAAEILEAHVVSSLSMNCQHLILIGDHQQLQPNPSVYQLAVHYKLNVSLFERLIKNGITFTRLEYQHRMKPCISNLLVPTIYKDLVDHPKVFTYPKILGVEKDLFFFDHLHLENKNKDDDESVSNLFEAEFAVALCRHLILQGYAAEDVTILTPYSGQHRLIKERQREFALCMKVRVSILDNYQGEECNIIILSLVRSNEDEKVGFVKSDNRVCVALSRAKHGFYMIGNMTQFVKASPLWSQLKQKLVEGNNIGSHLNLVCGNHTDEVIQVNSAQEFILKSPEGGCIRNCCAILPKCNHQCPRKCHVFDRTHSILECKLPCLKNLCNSNHPPCPKLCFEQCSTCEVLVKKILPCNHDHVIPCSTAPEQYLCTTEVEKELLCKHKAKMPCHFEIEDYCCLIDCDIILTCGHQCRKKCHVDEDPTHESYLCHEKCARHPENCQFSHTCKKLCYENCGTCNTIIKKNLPCGHTIASVPCGTPIESIKCQEFCKKTLLCSHATPCSKLCWEVCGGCKTKVVKTVPDCQHIVKMECGIVASASTCTAKCTKSLPCGHICDRKCNVPCNTICFEMVASQFQCPQNHTISLVCWLAKSTDQQYKDEDVWEKCSEICGVLLDCGHICQGRCGACFNGRFHVKCNSPCIKPLMCGHICQAPCSSSCPPCQSLCELKCNHRSCKHKCGMPCTPCKKLCIRGCAHSKCRKKCGEPCDWSGCDKPCLKKLPCGHPCIGFCGEVCPKLCRICNKDELENISLGAKNNVNSRFIVLEDCGHTFESTNITSLMNTFTGEIGLKKCPSCSKSVYNTKRFQSYILAALEDVTKVKAKYVTMMTNIPKKNLLNDLNKLWPVQKPEVIKLFSKLGYDSNFRLLHKQPNISVEELSLLEFQIEFLKSASQAKTKMLKKKHLVTNLEALIKKILSQDTCVSDQTRDEAVCELRRILISVPVKELHKHSHDTIKQLLGDIIVVMDPTIKFSAGSEKLVRNYLKEAEKIIGNLGISDTERMMTVRTFSLNQGRWFKCPNGHINSFDNCGGAMVETVCPECKFNISDESHRLKPDNLLAAKKEEANHSDIRAKMDSVSCSKVLSCGHLCKKMCNEPCNLNCQELVLSNFKCPRMHAIQLPCSLARRPSNKKSEDEDVWEKCSEICGINLDCGHSCKGKCGECFNGRFHIKCNSACNEILICGHKCKTLCSFPCPPCQSFCEMKCSHNSCKRKCGINCVNCKKFCKRGCTHSKCKKKCGDPCDWSGCDKPCLKKLACNHPCIGFCGEVCPKLCRICNKDEVENISIGANNNIDVRFIVLEDCGHTFESTHIMSWMNSFTGEIGLKKCPSCSKPVYNTKRFQSYILAALEDVKKVKAKCLKMKTTIPKKHLLNDLDKLWPVWNPEVLKLLSKLGYDSNFRLLHKQPKISDEELHLFQFQIEFLKSAAQVKTKLLKKKQQVTKLEALVKKIMGLNICISDQTRDEAICELRRILISVSVKELHKHSHDTIKQLLLDIKVIMEPSIKFSARSENLVRNYLKEAEKIIGSLGISNTERMMTVKNVGLNLGRWFKCQNGHINSFDISGGAMVETVCPECKLKINCESHQMTADNLPETEGANHSDSKVKMESVRCSKILACDHLCKKMCNEPCNLNCQELVLSNFKCPRKHALKLPCSSASQSTNQQSEEDIWEKCSEICGINLDCGHSCQGKCGDCFNGRFHAKCNSACNKILICGHVCKAICSFPCPPCQSICELKCNHDSCKKKCGINCFNCKKLCIRGCEHSKCSQKCGDPCDWSGCDKPCLKKLACGHPCIGFCGEVCPKLCRICNKDELENISLEASNNIDARFIVLKDCGHTFESTNIMSFMNTFTGEIGLKKCPSCIKPVYNTKRFQSYILAALEDVKKVKAKYSTMKANISKRDLLNDLNKLWPVRKPEVLKLLSKLGYNSNFRLLRKQLKIRDAELNLFQFQIEFLKSAEQVKTKLLKKKYQVAKLEALVKKIMGLKTFICDQTRDEAICELRRILISVSVKELHKHSHDTIKQLLLDIKVVMEPSIKFSAGSEKLVRNYLKEAEKIIGSLGISDIERMMAKGTLGFNQSCWFKCPNGHINSINNCGGSVVEAVCPECKLNISGKNH